ncbi:MAG: hypothetical protein WC707_05210 [Candidatus Babeliaceae bacterium]|jgi:hypothetical protein
MEKNFHENVYHDGRAIVFNGKKTIEFYADYHLSLDDMHVGPLSFSENNLALDTKSQKSHFFYNEDKYTFGNGKYGSTSFFDSLVIKILDYRIATFLKGKEEARNFDVSDMFTSKSGHHIMFDGFQRDDAGNICCVICPYANLNASIVYCFGTSTHGVKTFSTRLIAALDGMAKALAFKFPYVATATKDALFFKKVSSSDECKQYKISNLSKVSWLAGLNLLGLTDAGTIITIDLSHDASVAYNQKFGNLVFQDIAVDAEHPWQFVALTTTGKLIYADFSSRIMTCGNEAVKLFKPKKNYTVLAQFALTKTDLDHNKLWFYNNKIGIYSQNDITCAPDLRSPKPHLTIYQLLDNVMVLKL